AKFVAAKHLNGFRIRGRKLLASSNRCKHLRHGTFLELRSNRLKHEYRRVTGIPQITCRRIWNPRGIIVTRKVVAELDLPRHHADNLKAHALYQHRFANRWPAAE